MNKRICIIILLLTFRICDGQVLCIYCYDQNDTISDNVNNLVLNGGFENTTCTPNVTTSTFCPNSSNYSCDIINWTCTGGGPSSYSTIFNSSFSTVVEGTKAVYFGNSLCKACSSSPFDTSCLNYSGCTVTGVPAGFPLNTSAYGGTTGISLEQTVTGLITGNTYVLEFWAGGENNVFNDFPDNGLFAIDVGFGDTRLRNKRTGAVSFNHGDTIGTRYIIEFNATSSTHTIKFTNWGHICPSCTELIIDDVRLYTLAELSASVPHCTAAIADASASLNTVIYPNPITNELNIKTSSNQPSEIFLYDIASRKLSQEEFTNSIIINTEQLDKGIYFYEVRNRNGVIKKGKVVKD